MGVDYKPTTNEDLMLHNLMELREQQLSLFPKDKNVDPAHYNKWKIEPKDFIIENNLPFCEGNIIKYIMRWRDKNGVEDLMKAKQYIDFLIQHEQKQGK